jgi:hypothetical protein
MKSAQAAKGELNTAYREVRVSAGGIRLALARIWGWLSQVEWLNMGSMADAIRQRYAGQPARWLRLVLVFAQPQPIAVSQTRHYHPQVHLAPRLTLTVLGSRTQSGNGSPDRPLGNPVFGVIAPNSPDSGGNGPTKAVLDQEKPNFSGYPEFRVLESITRLTQDQRQADAIGTALPVRRVFNRSEMIELASPEQLVQRMVSRGQRIDTVSPPGLASLPWSGTNQAAAFPGASGLSRIAVPATDDYTPPRASVPLAKPVPRLVRRPPAATTAAGQAPTAARSKVDHDPQTAVTGNTPPTGAAPLNLNQLTDQVVQAIDHRIVAQRERLGRI